MRNIWRRFEVLLPLKFNDGRHVPTEQIADALLELVEHFDAATCETQPVEGHWRHEDIVYRDELVRVIVDAPDDDESRQWMKAFKARWKDRLEQIDLWVVSHRIDIE